jgi:GGDEF domain-containing protein
VLTIRPSIGIAMCPDDGATAEALLRNADAAMYLAKRNGSGYAFFEPDTQV